ncbi:uncharacterized protein [Panulirus ornatus]|uniref:uncharacterized protein isoform X2 n=1 Tax=Panulirus ornatus TaxID=150431 RepID=UPI003A8A0FB2
MVMNTFRSKLRRRRDELFRRGSDESDEWQFVPFNPSVYPAINNNTLNNNTNLNGRSCSGGPEAPPTPKPALRPWYLQRASWHEGHPPIPPHGHGSEVKGYFPLPPCPEPSPPPLPPHGHDYPGSVPPWYGAQFHAAPMQYPASVPPGQVRPSPVVLRRAARGPAPSTDDPPPPPPPPPITGAPRPTSGGSRPNSGGSRPPSGGSRPSSGNFRGSRPSSGGSDIVDGVTISPEGPAPQVPPHGRPAVPPHITSPRSVMPGTVTATAPALPPPPNQPLPPPPVPAHATQGPSQAHATHPTSLNISPAKPDSLNLEHLTPFLAPLLSKETNEAEQEVSRDSPEYKTPVDQSPEYKSPCDCSDCYPDFNNKASR